MYETEYMNSKELRYGNLISFKGHPCVVNNVHGASGLIHVLPNEKHSLATRSLMDFRPIVLGEDWFTLFGFMLNSTKDIVVLFTGSFGDTSLRKIDDYWSLWYDDSPMFNENVHAGKIRYVHQFQNLWFLLAGEELTIKE